MPITAKRVWTLMAIFFFMVLLWGCGFAFQETKLVSQSQDLLLGGPAVVANHGDVVVSGKTLEFSLVAESEVAAPYLDLDGLLSSPAAGETYAAVWEIYASDGEALPPSAYQGGAAPVKKNPGGTALEFSVVLAAELAAGEYRVEVQFLLADEPFGVVLAHHFTFVSPPPVLPDVLELNLRYACALNRSLDETDQEVLAGGVVLPADQSPPFFSLDFKSFCPSGGAYNVGYFVFEEMPPWVNQLVLTNATTPGTILSFLFMAATGPKELAWPYAFDVDEVGDGQLLPNFQILVQSPGTQPAKINFYLLDQYGQSRALDFSITFS